MTMRLRLAMEARHEGTAETRNVVAEIVGSEKPEEVRGRPVSSERGHE